MKHCELHQSPFDVATMFKAHAPQRGQASQAKFFPDCSHPLEEAASLLLIPARAPAERPSTIMGLLARHVAFGFLWRLTTAKWGFTQIRKWKAALEVGQDVKARRSG